MQITEETIDGMYKYSGVSKPKFQGCLNRYGIKKVDSKLVAEFVYFYMAPKGSQLQKSGNNYFVQWPDKIIVDLLAKDSVKYENAKQVKIQAPPSDEVQKLAELYGFTEDDLDVE